MHVITPTRQITRITHRNSTMEHHNCGIHRALVRVTWTQWEDSARSAPALSPPPLQLQTTKLNFNSSQVNSYSTRAVAAPILWVLWGGILALQSNSVSIAPKERALEAEGIDRSGEYWRRLCMSLVGGGFGADLAILWFDTWTAQ